MTTFGMGHMNGCKISGNCPKTGHPARCQGKKNTNYKMWRWIINTLTYHVLIIKDIRLKMGSEMLQFLVSDLKILRNTRARLHNSKKVIVNNLKVGCTPKVSRDIFIPTNPVLIWGLKYKE
jgi:hypothetical protein